MKNRKRLKPVMYAFRSLTARFFEEELRKYPYRPAGDAAADDGPTRGHGHAFTLTTVDRTLHLAAETPDELKEWLGAFTKYVQHNSLQKKIAQKRATRKY